MASKKYEDVRKLLTTPLDFQETYGNSPQTISNQEIQLDHWRGLTFRGWTFESVLFEQAGFQHCRFEGVTFKDCGFVLVGSKKSIFENCTFEGCAFIGGDWIQNKWQKGSMTHCHWLRDPLERGVPSWLENEFNDFRFTSISVEKGATHWTSCRFQGVQFHEYQFSHLGMEKCQFDTCEFFHGDWSQTGTGRTKECTFKKVRFLENQIEETFLGGDFEDMEFKEPKGASLWGTFRNIIVHPGANADFQDLESGQMQGRQGNVALETAKDVEIDEIGPQGRFLLGTGGAENVIVHRADLERVYFRNGTYRNCRFENWVVKEFWMSENATFVGCHFENILITHEIVVSGPVHFEDCHFTNMRRERGAKSFFNDDPGDFLFPFEIAGGAV